MRTRMRTVAMLLGGSALLAAVVLATAGRGRGEEDESAEPPQLLTLEVGGIRHPIEIGQPLTLKTGAGETVVVLRAEDHRVFPYGGVRFRYPAGYSFEADLSDPAGSIWTLDGSDVVMMVQRFHGRTDHAALRTEIARGTAIQLGIRRPRTSEIKTKLGGRELPGTHLELAIGGSKHSMDFYSLVHGGATVVLVIQDALTDDGKHSGEWKRTFEMLAGSFEVASGR